MVQRKVSNKLDITTIHDNKRDSSLANNMKPSSAFNHDGLKTSKGTHHELLKKTTTMIRKSRSFKRSESDCLHLPSVRRNDPPPARKPTPPQSPSKVQSPPQRSPTSSPNYMKSTTSSQARKEHKTQLTSVQTPQSSRSSSPITSKRLSFSSTTTTTTTTSPSTSSSHKLSSRSTLSRTSSLKKFRKTPSFKLSRSSSTSTSKCASKVVFTCSTLEAQKATCSSTLKDSKFPPYLDLHPGGTESEGTSIAKVCPYTYCSLNGHYHKPSIPLRCFLASRRRMMKTQKSMKRKGLGLSSPRRAAVKVDTTHVELQFEKAAVREESLVLVNGDVDEFFVEIYAEEKEEQHELVADDGDSKADEVSQETLKNIIEEAGNPEGCLTNQNLEEDVVSAPSPDTTSNLHEPESPNEWDISTSITLEELFAQSSDMEWDYDGPLLTGLDGISGSASSDSDRDYHDQASEDSESKYETTFLEQEQSFEVDETLAHTTNHDETIMEQLSDFDSLSLDDMEMEIDGLAAQDCIIEDNGDNTSEDHHEVQLVIFQGSDNEPADSGLEQLGNSSQLVNEMEAPEDYDDDSKSLIETENSSLASNVNNEEDGGEKSSRKRRSEDTEEQSSSSLKKLCPIDMSNEGPKQTETDMVTESSAGEGSFEQEKDTKESLNKTNYKRGIRENPDNCTESMIKIIKGRKPAEEEMSNELKEFNPREPNFLPLEAEPDAEKVDLRHQEMEKRKNAEEWMMDFALRKTVDKLGTARKKKVALLVEAFEKVMPAYRYETHTASVPSGFLSPGRLQACN